MAKKSSHTQKEQLFKETFVAAKAGSGKLFDVNYEVGSTNPVECLGVKFPNDKARRTYFTEKLREKLKDSEFRKIEGFPIGDDEDILALSDPPYYTACPNPFLKSLLMGRASDDKSEDRYQREPYAFDVSEGKGDQSYYIHSYHTKVPPSAVAKYVDHYADDRSVILDCFSGSGMTGLGASITDKKDLLTVLLDLGTAPTFISYFHNCFRPEVQHFRLLEELRQFLQNKYDSWYCTGHNGWLAANDAPSDWQTREEKGNGTGQTKFVVWSTVVSCPECGNPEKVWDLCVNLSNNTSSDVFECPSCKATLVKERKFVKRHAGQLVLPVLESFNDLQLGKTIQRIKRSPVLVSYIVGRTRYEKSPGIEDIENVRNAEVRKTQYWCPVDRMPEGDESRRNDEVGITHAHHFFPARTLHVLASAWDFLSGHDPGLRGLVTGILTRSSWQNRYMPQHRGNRSREVVGPLSGTLYVPYFSLEINPVEYLYEKGLSVLKSLSTKPKSKAFITTQSASSMSSVLPEKSIDYSFIDPPFGSNLQYAELSFVLKSWLKVRTASKSEAVVNDSRGVDVDDYCDRMRNALSELAKSLKPGRWVTLEFHNSQNAIWAAIQVAINEAGLVIADVRTLDKKKGTTKQLTNANAVQQDLVITAYRPTEELESLLILHTTTVDAVWDFVRTHLALLPTFVITADGSCEVLAERQDYLLFDRLIACFIQRGILLPLSAAEFYDGLRQRFALRDGMFFLPEQVGEYDQQKLKTNKIEQLQLFVNDEKTAIRWVRQQLNERQRTYQELSPLYMKEAQRVWEKHEAPLELITILEQNFVKDEFDKWRVPDPRKEVDLEQLRTRSLLKEFQQYVDSKGKLKVVRTEALRVGFKEAWQLKNYSLIIQIAKRLPDAVIQEDPALLMYFDNASLLLGE